MPLMKDSSESCLVNEEFEREIGYFYGIEDMERVEQYYLEGLKGVAWRKKEEKVIECLEKAYEEVKVQRGWDFNVRSAAELEHELIMANRKGVGFEKFVAVMKRLYAVVFNEEEEMFEKAGWLRVFLYQYKGKCVKRGRISEEDKQLLIDIAKRSEDELRKFERKMNNEVK